MKLCKCTGEQIEVPTYADTGRGIMPKICADCGTAYTERYDWRKELGDSAEDVCAFLESDEFRDLCRRLGITADEALRR